MYTAGTWIPAGLVALVVVAGVLTEGLGAAGEVRSQEPGTPESAAQAYLDAVVSGKTERAAELLASESDCDARDLEQVDVSPDAYVMLRTASAGTTTADVDISVTSGSTGLVPTAWSEDASLRLVREGADWRLAGSPWPMFECRTVLP